MPCKPRKALYSEAQCSVTTTEGKWGLKMRTSCKSIEAVVTPWVLSYTMQSCDYFLVNKKLEVCSLEKPNLISSELGNTRHKWVSDEV